MAETPKKLLDKNIYRYGSFINPYDSVFSEGPSCSTNIECCIHCGFGNPDEPVDCGNECYCSGLDLTTTPITMGRCAGTFWGDEQEDELEDPPEPDPPNIVRDSCEYRFGDENGDYGAFVLLDQCDFSQTNPPSEWLCNFMALIGGGMYPYLFDGNNWDAHANYHIGQSGGLFSDEEQYLNNMPGCVVGAFDTCIENCEGSGQQGSGGDPDLVTGTFACNCNGDDSALRALDYDWSNHTESYRWHMTPGMTDSTYLNQHITANICVREPGGTIDTNDVWGKCTNGNPPQWLSPELRTLQDHGGYPVYGYCCDVDAVNYSGNLACSVATEGNWVPLPSKSDSHNIPAYYYYDDDGITRTLQRYHVDEGKDSGGNTCPTFEETHYYDNEDWYDCWNDLSCGFIEGQSRRDPLGIKKSSCFCKYVDSTGNICFGYEMYIDDSQGTQTCYPSEHTPYDAGSWNQTAFQSRLGMSRTLEEDELRNSEDSLRMGRHYIPNFADGWSADLLSHSSGECDENMTVFVVDLAGDGPYPTNTPLPEVQCIDGENCFDVAPSINSFIELAATYGDELDENEDGIVTICIPAGDYYIGKDISITASNITLKGATDDNGEPTTRLYFGLIAGSSVQPNEPIEKFNKIINCVFENSAATNTSQGTSLDLILDWFQVEPSDDCDALQNKLFQSTFNPQIEQGFQDECKDSWTDGAGGWPDNFSQSQAWRSTCKKWWAQSNSDNVLDDNYNYGYELYDCVGEGNCTVYDELFSITGDKYWYVDCGEIGVNCSSNICNSILGSAFKYGCFMTEENLHSDPNRQRPSYYNMQSDYLDRCTNPSNKEECNNQNTSDNTGCLLQPENGVCKGFYKWEWHEDTDGEHFESTLGGYSGGYMPDTEYPYNIQGGVSANRLGFYDVEADGTDLRMTPNEMFETFYIGGYCNPDTNQCEVHQNASDEDREFYETRARYVNIDTGETEPLNGRPCGGGGNTSGYADINECGYEKVAADFCGGSCAQRTAALKINGGLIADDGNPFKLVETALNNSNYIYVEDNDVLACGDDIVISIPKDESTIEDLIRADHNCEDYWGNKIKFDIFYRTITKIITEENGILKLTLDTPIRYKLDLSYEPYVMKIISGWVENSSIENLKVSNAVDFDNSVSLANNIPIISVESAKNCIIKNVKSFSDENFAKAVHQDESIDLIGNVDGLNSSIDNPITQLMCVMDRLNHLNEFEESNFDEEEFLSSIFDGLGLDLANIPTKLKYYSLDGVETVYNELQNNDITEASGLVHSREYPDVFWTHNDSNSLVEPNIIYAFNSNGVDLGEFTLTGLTEPVNNNGETIHQRDWEDIATHTDVVTGVSYLYIGEIGDNNTQYGTYYVHKCLEPNVNEPPTDNEISCTSIPFTYQKYNSEGEPTEGNVSYDAETLMVDTNGDIYIITKGALDFTNGSGDSKVFKLDIATNVANYVTDVSAFEDGQFIFLNQITGGDISKDGTSILIRTYEKIYKFNKSGTGEASVRAAINGEFVAVAYGRELLEQGEAVAWAANGLGYYTISEEGTMYDKLIEKIRDGVALLQFLTNGCPDGYFEPGKNVFDEIMQDTMTISNPSNVTNESRHLISNGINIDNSKHIVIKNCTFKLPQKRGEGGNGYLFNIITGNEILIEDCYGYRGRHNFTTAGLFATSGIVYNRIKSEGGWGFYDTWDDYWSRYQEFEFPGLGFPGLSDTHQGLTQTFLVTDSDLYDGFSTKNRHNMSDGAGITGANGTFWNVRGPVTTGERWENMSVPGMGVLESFQYGLGLIKDTDSNINLMRDINNPYQYIKNLSSIATELITGEYISPNDYEEPQYSLGYGFISHITDLLIKKFISKFTGNHLSSIPQSIVQDVNVGDLGAPVACIYDIGVRYFSCPDGNETCNELFTNIQTNVSYDNETNNLEMRIGADRLQINFAFYMYSQIGGPFDICAVLNTEYGEIWSDNWSDSYVRIYNPEIIITINGENNEFSFDINFNSIDFYAEDWITDPTFSQDLIFNILDHLGIVDIPGLVNNLMDQTLMDKLLGDDGAINGALVDINKKLSSLIKDDTFTFIRNNIFTPLSEQTPSEKTGPSDKILLNELSSGTNYNDEFRSLAIPIYGYDEMISGGEPVGNVTNSNNLFEYQKNWGNWFSSNESTLTINNQINDGIFQSPSVGTKIDQNAFYEDCPFDWGTISDGSGDVNGDGIVNIQDIVIMIEYILNTNIGVIPNQSIFIRIADINNDGGVNILDVIALINNILDSSRGFNPYDDASYLNSVYGYSLSTLEIKALTQVLSILQHQTFDEIKKARESLIILKALYTNKRNPNILRPISPTK